MSRCERARVRPARVRLRPFRHHHRCQRFEDLSNSTRVRRFNQNRLRADERYQRSPDNHFGHSKSNPASPISSPANYPSIRSMESMNRNGSFTCHFYRTRIYIYAHIYVRIDHRKTCARCTFCSPHSLSLSFTVNYSTMMVIVTRLRRTDDYTLRLFLKMRLIARVFFRYICLLYLFMCV